MAGCLAFEHNVTTTVGALLQDTNRDQTFSGRTLLYLEPGVLPVNKFLVNSGKKNGLFETIQGKGGVCTLMFVTTPTPTYSVGYFLHSHYEK